MLYTILACTLFIISIIVYLKYKITDDYDNILEILSDDYFTNLMEPSKPIINFTDDSIDDINNILNEKESELKDIKQKYELEQNELDDLIEEIKIYNDKITNVMDDINKLKESITNKYIKWE